MARSPALRQFHLFAREEKIDQAKDVENPQG
jgi:hypothetical protein